MSSKLVPTLNKIAHWRNSDNLHALSVVLPKAYLNYQKPLGYKSVKPRHLQAVWALEYTRAITIRALVL